MSTSTPLPSASSATAARGRARAALGKTFQSLATYNFRLFFIGQLISNTGNQLTNVALILFVLKLGHSGLAVGALAACQFGPLVVLSAWAGAVADRTDKRRALLVTQSLEMAQSVGARRARVPAPSVARRCCTRSPSRAACSWPSTTRSGARSSRRWCRRTTCRTRSCSTARSSPCRRSRVRRWRARSSRPSASAGASPSTRSRTSR